MRIEVYKRAWFNTILLVCLSMMLLCGCGAASNGNAEVTDVLAETVKESDSVVPLWQGTYRSSLLQEDEKYFYLCGSCRISKVDKTTGAEQILWENAKEAAEKDAAVYESGSGLLLGDKIYFIEHWTENNWSTDRAFSCVNTDGSGYERLAELSGGSDSLYLSNGMLYVDDFEQRLAYQVFEDGCLSAPEKYEEGFLPDNQLYYEQYGSRILFEAESMEEFGFLMSCINGSDIVMRNTTEDRLTYIHELYGFSAFNSRYFLCKGYEDGWSLKLVERQQIAEKYVEGKDITIEPRTIYMQENSLWLLGMDEEYAYIMQWISEDDADGGYSFDRISLETGERQTIFERAYFHDGYTAINYMQPIVRDGYLYYIDEIDYAYYLMCKRTDGTGEAERIMAEAIHNTGIAKIGSIQTFCKEIYSKRKPEIQLYDINLRWLAVDDRYPGSNLINTYLNAHQEANISISEQEAEDMEEWAEEVGNTMYSQMQSEFSDFGYFDSHYISFVQRENQYYSGAAHGMPYWVSFTFDLETGEKLLLSDICNNSEAEIKEIVTRYFKEMIDKTPEDFWPDAVETVRETITLESDFYLTEEGIVFYYGPYALACYAAGFQEVTIPYEEFDMTIILDKTANWN